jgi:hypothetical protein
MGVVCIAVLSPSVRNIVFLLQGSKPDRNIINSGFCVLQNVPLYLRAFESDEEAVLNAQLTTHAALDVLDERGKHNTFHGIITHCCYAFSPITEANASFFQFQTFTGQITVLQLCKIYILFEGLELVSPLTLAPPFLTFSFFSAVAGVLRPATAGLAPSQYQGLLASEGPYTVFGAVSNTRTRFLLTVDDTAYREEDAEQVQHNEDSALQPLPCA